MKKLKQTFVFLMAILLLFSPFSVNGEEDKENTKKYIKWVDFTPTTAALKEAAKLDIEHHSEENAAGWVQLLSYYSARHGGSYSDYRTGALAEIVEAATQSGNTVEELGQALENAKTYRYYLEAYHAVLDGMLGLYRTADGETTYGIRAVNPIAGGYYYSDYDDFGASRSYGYRRRHLGHDMLGSVGTPIVAMESGYVECCGWNQYGGWRIGIRSFDNKRYYYYAHLRKDHPYSDLFEGKIVHAGDVIGYLGMTGYSAKENVNNINVPHLHVGMELIFAPEQKDGYCQLWIDMYQITNFLASYRSQVQKTADGRDSVAVSPLIYDITPD